MQKKLIITLAALLILALAVPALAASSGGAANPVAGVNTSATPAVNPLTPEQAKEITAIHQQMLDLRKQIVDKYVEYGRLTSEQGEQIKERINARQQYLQENPGAFGPGNCPYSGQRMGRGGRGGAGFGPGAGGRGFGGGMGPGQGPCGWGTGNTAGSTAPSS